MKIKTGIDIIEVNRIQEAIEKSKALFLNRVYAKQEIEFCESTNKMKYQHYAARFAAKEAVFKAISDLLPGNKEDIWKNIIVKNEKSGKPIVEFDGALDFLNSDKFSIDLSISHIKEYAVASFVLLINE